jgi:hypothetical protein
VTSETSAASEEGLGLLMDKLRCLPCSWSILHSHLLFFSSSAAEGEEGDGGEMPNITDTSLLESLSEFTTSSREAVSLPSPATFLKASSTDFHLLKVACLDLKALSWEELGG